MSKAKKIVALALGAVMSAATFVGCSSKEMELYNAFNKSQKITSLESKTAVSIKVAGKNLSAEEQGFLAQLPLKDGIKIGATSKINVNADKTINKSEVKMNLGVSGMAFDIGVWSDANLSGDKPVIKSIVAIPEIAKLTVPQLSSKDYLFIDSAKILEQASSMGQTDFDYKKIANLAKDFQPKVDKFVDNYIKQYNFNKNVINTIENKEMIINGKSQQVNIYEIKLNDELLKDLLRYSANNLGENKASIEALIKDYLTLLGVQEEVKLPEFTKDLNAGLDAIKDIKILGEKGLVVKFAVNKDGYIVNTNGSVDFVFDTATLKGQASGATGIYTVTLDFNTEVYNINENVKVELPSVTSANSIDYMEFLNSMIIADKTVEKNTTNNKTLSPLDIAYKEAFDNTKTVVDMASVFGVKPYYFKVEGSLEVGPSNAENVVEASNSELQTLINEARASINKLPNNLLQEKRTLSSIVDNYQHPIYEVTVKLIEGNKVTPKQNHIIMARKLVSSVPVEYKTSYSSALDEAQQVLLNKASDLVNKAVETKNQQDVDSAKLTIAELKTIPANFAGEGVLKLIADLEGKLK